MLNTPEDEATVRTATQAWIDAFNRADTTAIAALYHPQAVLWGTTSPLLIDTPASIAGYFAAVFALRPAPRMALGEARARLFGEVAVSTGLYTLELAGPGSARAVPARFSFVYRRVGAGWSIVDHHSSAMPTPLADMGAAARP